MLTMESKVLIVFFCRLPIRKYHSVTPAQAGVQWNLQERTECHWIHDFQGRGDDEIMNMNAGLFTAL